MYAHVCSMWISVWVEEDLCLGLSHSSMFYWLVWGCEGHCFFFKKNWQVLYAPVRDFKGIPGCDKLHICLTGYQKNWRDDIMVCMVNNAALITIPHVSEGRALIIIPCFYAKTVHGQAILLFILSLIIDFFDEEVICWKLILLLSLLLHFFFCCSLNMLYQYS